MPNARKRRVESYDGQLVWINGEAQYDLGNYLGGGAAGVVYEATNLKASSDHKKNVAVKILNPVGFKLMSSGPLQRCILARKGQPVPNDSTMGPEHVWWCVHPGTKVLIPAIPDSRTNLLKELPLPKCIEIWGWDPLNEGKTSGSDDELSLSASDGASGGKHGINRGNSNMNFSNSLNDETIEKLAKSSGESIKVDGLNDIVEIPQVPIKYIRWLKARQNIYKEISHMAHLGKHTNVIGLYEVLEYIQDSKTTLFLVLEMVTGGELFDKIKIGKGTSELTAKQYFCQLVDGVCYCHSKGVCHRDLKPENLLLADSSEKAVLKIADFGLSAAFAIAAHSTPSESNLVGAPSTPVNIRRLRSVVGSPHYVAPEVTNEQVTGYDGPKADCWSAGVILYAILAGNLPFGKELFSCERYLKFKKWISLYDIYCMNNIIHIVPLEQGRISSNPLEGLNWFFPKHFPYKARGLLVALLHPEPSHRPTMEDIRHHEWVRFDQNTPMTSAAAEEDVGQQLANLNMGSDADVARALQHSFDDLVQCRSQNDTPPPPPL